MTEVTAGTLFMITAEYAAHAVLMSTVFNIITVTTVIFSAHLLFT
ncbi:hypothetical protein [Bacillus salipaludis]|uniref:Uncharacterized protein n=1 Tax=Bacillus salipaludis TaxID=2547811 RepID=A0AA90TU72_9BACI|nr:hypothetical protein [Bacillus salipaludis]MDQ6599054.1 hypothetical protein [Bacillus salipaludis]